jgi:hypothetical protein
MNLAWKPAPALEPTLYTLETAYFGAVSLGPCLSAAIIALVFVPIGDKTPVTVTVLPITLNPAIRSPKPAKIVFKVVVDRFTLPLSNTEIAVVRELLVATRF